jgi:glutamyl-tRNA synthetase
MEWLGLDYDEVHYQSKREEVYRHYLTKMLQDGHCEKGLEGEIRLSVPYQQVYSFTDTLRGTVRVSEQEYMMHKELVVARCNGSALYHFASIIDDIDMGVTNIIRGADHLPNTHKQEAIRSLSSPETEFAYTHVGLITVEGKKISKRNPDHVHIASLQSYIDQGFSPEAFKNWILRIGWSPKQDNKENSVIPQDKALQLFVEHGSMKAKAANMDLSHLHSYHKKYGGVLVAK